MLGYALPTQAKSQFTMGHTENTDPKNHSSTTTDLSEGYTPQQKQTAGTQGADGESQQRDHYSKPNCSVNSWKLKMLRLGMEAVESLKNTNF